MAICRKEPIAVQKIIYNTPNEVECHTIGDGSRCGVGWSVNLFVINVFAFVLIAAVFGLRRLAAKPGAARVAVGWRQ